MEIKHKISMKPGYQVVVTTITRGVTYVKLSFSGLYRITTAPPAPYTIVHQPEGTAGQYFEIFYDVIINNSLYNRYHFKNKTKQKIVTSLLRLISTRGFISIDDLKAIPASEFDTVSPDVAMRLFLIALFGLAPYWKYEQFI